MSTSKICKFVDDSRMAIVTPIEAIASMFAHTDADGVLCIPAWPHDAGCDVDYEDGHFFRCRMKWSRLDAEKAVTKYEALYAAIEKIASEYGHLCTAEEAAVLPPAFREIWDTYLRNFDIGDVEEPSEEEREADEVSDEYIDALWADAERRVGSSVAAYDVVSRARRTYRLMTLHAPKFIIDGEALLLAQAIAVHGYCKGLEYVEDIHQII